MPSNKPIAITCGDPAGVGPEIILSWLMETKPQNIEQFVFIGPQAWLNELKAAGAINMIAVGSADFVMRPGEPTLEGAQLAYEALRVASVPGEFSGVVTAPINKQWIQQAGFTWPGHTEFFAEMWGGSPVMAFAGGKLKVVLATTHIPLSEVPRALTPAILTNAIEAADLLVKKLDAGIVNPRIGVCGLNPHAGEGGLIGSEEQDWINPLLQSLKAEFPGLLAVAQSADTLFWRHLKGELDVVVALYHDQGLAPLKLIDFDEAVNITLGLPFVRTSPDHGTAYAIAGKGVASCKSFCNAVEICLQFIYK